MNLIQKLSLFCVAILFCYVPYHTYMMFKHETLGFTVETTYLKDSYSYIDNISDCVMYDPTTTDAITVSNKLREKYILPSEVGLKQKISITKGCKGYVWIFIPNHSEIYK